MGHMLLLAPRETRDAIRDAVGEAFHEPGLTIPDLSRDGYPDLEPGDALPPQQALALAGQHPKAARILIAALRCTAALARLRDAGYAAERAGNRVYGGDASAQEIAALPGDTLLEQLVGWARADPQADQLADALHIEAWQRDGWAGLSAKGVAPHAAMRLAPTRPHRQIIAADGPLVIRHELDDLTLAVIEAASPAPLSKPDVAELIRLLQLPTDTLGDTGQHTDNCPAAANPGDYAWAQCRHQPVQLRPVLLLHQRGGEAGPANTGAIEYLGGREHLPWLARLLADPALSPAFDLCLTAGRHRVRLWAQPAAGTDAAQVDALISRLLQVVLVTGRPLREYSCTFYLPLDLYLDDELLRPEQSPPASLTPPAPIERHRIAGGAQAAMRLRDVIDAADHSDNHRALACRLSRLQFAPHEKVVPDGVTGEQLAEAQAILYFLPALQARVFDTADEARAEADHGDQSHHDGIRHWRLPQDAVRGAELKVLFDADPRAAPHHGIDEITAAVQDISLFGYTNGLHVLAVRVGFADAEARQARCFAGTGADWWHPLLGWRSAPVSAPGQGWDTLDQDHQTCRAPNPERLQAERWLTFTKGARLLRPAFAQQGLEKKIQRVRLRLGDADPEFHREALSPVLLHLLTRLTGWDFSSPSSEQHRRLLQIRDDRMVVNVAYALAGPPPSADPAARDALERLFSLALFVDQAADGVASQGGYAYDRDFTRAQLAACVNRRWAGLGSLYGSTQYSQAALGVGDYFAGPVARLHVPDIHGRLLLLVLCHDLTLTWLDRCITRITHNLGGLEPAPVTEPEPLDAVAAQLAGFQQRFIRFTNDHWFRTVTAQTQGLETHRLMTRAFGLDAKYELVKDKIERSHDSIGQLRDRVRDDESHHQTRLATALGRWGPPLALAALLLALLQIPAHTADTLNALETYHLVRTKLRALELGAFLRANWNFVAAAGVLAFAVIVWLVKRPGHADRHRGRRRR
ncbi:hypothetical protein [uncultured Thiohalocapsa sp.]|uniref:hypothetical protein n=1 Tax=uncultured Thiohalocapsa sp. TaxID=768990 RepID=UPI0025DEBA00|nr:hypothetical protein [uncultured Thiohalocapsa sp.]